MLNQGNHISLRLEDVPPLPSTGGNESSDDQHSLRCPSPRGDAPFGATDKLQLPHREAEHTILRDDLSSPRRYSRFFSYGTSPITDPVSAVTVKCPSSELASTQPDRLVLDDTHSTGSSPNSAVGAISNSNNTTATATDTTSRQSPTTPDE